MYVFSYPVQKYRIRINARLALQIFLLRQIRITNFTSHAEEICIAFIRVRYFCNAYLHLLLQHSVGATSAAMMDKGAN